VSLPRQVTAGSTVFVSRRCDERRFLLRPDDYVTQAFLYCLAYAATECNILIHGFVAMSNHFHLLLTDPDGCLPVFMERFDGLLARSLNAYRGRWESFFAPGSYSAVQLDTQDDSLAKLTYILTNPVAAGLVDHARRWTGATSVRWRFGESRTVSRPGGGFFRPDSTLPDEVTLRLAPLPNFDSTVAEFDGPVRERLIARETEIRAATRSAGRTFAGMDEVLRCDPEGRPHTREPRRRVNPRVAGSDRDVRIQATIRWSSFVRMYREAWLRWRDGDHAVAFPEGTWLMRVRHRAACDARPSASAHPPPPS
jgi:putative transposase